MSKIAILAKAPFAAPVIAAAAKILALPLGEARLRIETGRPLYEGLLFMNDHLENADRLRSLVELFDKAGVSFCLFELEEDEDFASAPQVETEIDAAILSNILSEWESRNESF